MKKVSFILSVFSIFISTCSYAQITIERPIEKVDKAEKEVKYDSLSNINEANIRSLKGQTIFVKGTPDSKEDGFRNLFFEEKGFKSQFFEKRVYKQVEKNGLKYTPYNLLEGKYLVIEDIYIQKYPRDNEIYEYSLLLKNEEDSLYCYLSGRDPAMSNFIILGYYEKLKEKYVGKTFKATGKNVFTKFGTDEHIQIAPGTILKCVDITITLAEYVAIHAVLENSSIGKIKTYFGNEGLPRYVIDINYFNKLVKKYGTQYANLIIAKQVKVGMTKQMVLESWGQPYEGINETTGSFGVHEQWCYGNGKYLYFENGKLTTIQD